jgi:hypothetical protein
MNNDLPSTEWITSTRRPPTHRAGTHSCLSDALEIDPQVRADQMGHSVDVNRNKYTRSSLERRRKAVNALEKALGVM